MSQIEQELDASETEQPPPATESIEIGAVETAWSGQPVFSQRPWEQEDSESESDL